MCSFSTATALVALPTKTAAGNETVAATKTVAPNEAADATVFEGVVTRIMGDFKFGFVQTTSSDAHQNLFFHFSELSDEDKACVSKGSFVSFEVQKNPWAKGAKSKAVRMKLLSGACPTSNPFKDLEGVAQSDLRAFCFIDYIKPDTGEKVAYYFQNNKLVHNAAAKAANFTVLKEHRLLFDAGWNHKYSPPKPFATNVRIAPGQDDLNAAAAARANRYAANALGRSLSSASPLARGESWRDSMVGTIGADDGPVLASNRYASGGSINTEMREAELRSSSRNSMRRSGSQSGGGDKSGGMGRAALRVLVVGIFGEIRKAGTLTGTDYLSVRNALQQPQWVGRALTAGERKDLGSILHELDTSAEPTRGREGEGGAGFRGAAAVVHAAAKWKAKTNSKAESVSPDRRRPRQIRRCSSASVYSNNSRSPPRRASSSASGRGSESARWTRGVQPAAAPAPRHQTTNRKHYQSKSPAPICVRA